MLDPLEYYNDFIATIISSLEILSIQTNVFVSLIIIQYENSGLTCKIFLIYKLWHNVCSIFQKFYFFMEKKL